MGGFWLEERVVVFYVFRVGFLDRMLGLFWVGERLEIIRGFLGVGFGI